MRIVGRLAADVLDMIAPHVVPGVTTNQLNDLCHNFIVDVQQAIPSPLNYRGFPKSICTSINHQVCHGIPSEKKLKSGDIINIDITVFKDGFHGDTSMMFCVGTVSAHAQRLCDIARESLFLGIEQIKSGTTLGDIGNAIQTHAEKIVIQWYKIIVVTELDAIFMKNRKCCITACLVMVWHSKQA